MKVHVLNTREQMGRLAGKAVEDKIIALLEKQEEVRIIFAAAPSQNEFLDYLCKSSIIPWNKITAFQMDEYIGLPPDSPQLFSNFLKVNLFDKVNFKAVYLMNGNNNCEEECSRYASLLSEKPLDIVCMGIGENGHIAFNDPPVANFYDKKVIKEVELDLECRQQQVNDGCFEALHYVPESAFTLTIPTLMSGRFLYCMVPGIKKKKAVTIALQNSVSTACPASILKTHASCQLFLDEEAYGKPSPPFELSYVDGINCISGKQEKFAIRNGKIFQVDTPEGSINDLQYIGPGLTDVQVNGVNGIDFNNISLTESEVAAATRYLLSIGVTTFFPTVITNTDENVLKILRTIKRACEADTLVDSCVGGIHLEGPFLSKIDGARGAHNEKYIRSPEWSLFIEFQEASGDRIKLVTLAPELENSTYFIRKCKENNILVAIGHSLATSEEIDAAVEAGASLSTHLGNAVPLMLPRHPNIIWDQLAADQLYASIIADGFHLSDAFLKVVIRAKGDRTLLISDGTCFSGMAPGIYKTHIGEEVILDEEGKLALNNDSGLLAGASKTLLEDVHYLMTRGIVSLDQAWKMGSVNPAQFMGMKRGYLEGETADLVLFELHENKIYINKVIKKGRVVFEEESVVNKEIVNAEA